LKANARFDAYAYAFGTDSIPKRAFGFRERSVNQKLNTAVQHLNENCDGDRGSVVQRDIDCTERQ